MAEPDVNLHPDEPERAASAKRTSTCRTCAQRGIFQMAHRILRDGSGQFGICNWHFRGDKHPEELKAPVKPRGDGVARTTAVQAGRPGSTPVSPLQHSEETKKKPKEAVEMKQKVCGESGCGKALRVNNRSGFCTKHFYRPKQKGGAGRKRGRPAGVPKERVAPAAASNSRSDGVLGVSEAALDGWWASLADEVKAEAFNLVMARA